LSQSFHSEKPRYLGPQESGCVDGSPYLWICGTLTEATGSTPRDHVGIVVSVNVTTAYYGALSPPACNPGASAVYNEGTALCVSQAQSPCHPYVSILLVSSSSVLEASLCCHLHLLNTAFTMASSLAAKSMRAQLRATVSRPVAMRIVAKARTVSKPATTNKVRSISASLNGHRYSAKFSVP
jgi:hypothetical protein